ncbi:MAG: hypothetical protein ABR612_11085 [Chromatocurvus sp.]
MPSPIYFPRSIAAYGSAGIEAILKQEIEALSINQLPLMKGLRSGNYVLDSKIETMIISITADAKALHVKAGIFFPSIIAGCSCADDPSPVEAQQEYCELLFKIVRETAVATVALSDA